MGIVTHLDDPMHRMAAGVTGSCTFCGEPSTAFWAELGKVEVCRGCAERVLPALAADAVTSLPHRELPDRALERMTTAFWRAVASAINAERRRGG